MAGSSTRTKRWTRAEYDRLIDLGAFEPGERLELVGGVLLVREPQGGPHATAVGLVEDALRVAFGAGWTVRSRSPIALDEESEPAPDIAVWIVNLREQALEVYREPLVSPETRYGHRYGVVVTLHGDERVSPLSVPAARILVADLLP